MIDTNESLLERVKSMDAHDAWQEFYKAYWSAILRYARKLGLNEHQAQEVLQDTMIALMRQLPGFDYDPRKGKFRNFLLTIVHRKGLAALRRVQMAQQRDSDANVETLGAGHNGDLPDQEIARWREALMDDAIERLKHDPGVEDETREIFWAYVIDNQPADKVAARFRCKPNAVYQIKNRLTRRLQTQVARRLRDSGSKSNKRG